MSYEKIPFNPPEVEPGSALEKDISAYSTMYSLLEQAEQSQWAKDIPAGYVPLRNVDFFDAFGGNYLAYRAQQAVGLDVLMAGQDANVDSTISQFYKEALLDGAATAYAREDQEELSNRLLRQTNKHPMSEFLRLINNRATSWAFDESYPESWVNNPKLGELKKTDLLQRGFMTGVLKRCIADSELSRAEYEDQISPRMQEVHLESADIYNKLAETGFKPLGFEEIFGFKIRATLESLEVMGADTALLQE